MRKLLEAVDDYFRNRFNSGLALVLALVALAVLAGLLASKFGLGELANDIGKWGQVGDYFGGLMNPVLALLTLVGVWTGVNIQRTELKATKEALQGQVAIDIVFRQLDLHARVTDQVNVFTRTGRSSFALVTETISTSALSAWLQIRGNFNPANGDALTWNNEKALNPSGIEGRFEESYPALPYIAHFERCYAAGLPGDNASLESRLGHYFRSVYSLIRTIQSSPSFDDRQKSDLTDILRAQLTEQEFVVLALNGSIGPGRKFRARAILCDFFRSRLRSDALGQLLLPAFESTDENVAWASAVIAAGD
jgi:Putative phage abortive infection protein